MNSEPKQDQSKGYWSEMLQSTQDKLDSSTTVIAVPSCEASGLEARVSPHFGHATAYTFVQVHPDGTLSATSETSPYLDGHTPGQVPAFVAMVGARVVLACQMGKGAIALFEKLGIETRTCPAGTVRQAVRAYLQGELGAPKPCKGHWHGDGQHCGCEHHATR